MAICHRKKRRGTHTSAKHPDGTYITVSKRKDGRWSGYYYELDRDGNLDRSKRHNLCCTDRDTLIANIIKHETPKATMFAEVANQWWSEKLESIAYHTAGSYSPCFRRVVARFSDYALDEIEIADVNAFICEIAAQGYSRRTVQMHKDITSMVFQYAISHGMLKYNPVDYAVIPKGLPKKERELPSREELDAVCNGANLPFGCFAYICLFGGLRLGEALALRYEDVDRKRRIIHVTKSVEWVGNTPHIKPPKTPHSIRDVHVPAALLKIIPLGIGPIFPRDNRPGELLRQSDFRRKWRQFCADAGINITPHQLRHAYATMLYAAGVGVKEAQERLGHAKAQTTLDVYTHIMDEMRERADEQLDNFIFERFGLDDGDSDGKNAQNA